MDMMERTLILLKPDAFYRRLIGEIVSRFEKRGFVIVGVRLVRLSEEFARAHYAEHKGKEFYEPLVRYITSGPTVAMVLEGKNAVPVAREMLGRTFGSDSPPGSIRGDYALSNRFNLVHASDSPEKAAQEIQMFFNDDELIACGPEEMRWTYDMSGPEPV